MNSEKTEIKCKDCVLIKDINRKLDSLLRALTPQLPDPEEISLENMVARYNGDVMAALGEYNRLYKLKEKKKYQKK